MLAISIPVDPNKELLYAEAITDNVLKFLVPPSFKRLLTSSGRKDSNSSGIESTAARTLLMLSSHSFDITFLATLNSKQVGD
jgi:hypothetical protein